MGRTAGREEDTGGRLVSQGQLMAGQARRETGTGSGAHWEVTGPFLGMQLPFLPTGSPWGEVAQDPPAHPGPAAPELAENCDTVNCPLALVTYPEGCPGSGGDG